MSLPRGLIRSRLTSSQCHGFKSRYIALLKYQTRHQSTHTTESSSTLHPNLNPTNKIPSDAISSSSSSTPPPPPKQKRLRRFIRPIYTICFLALGSMIGGALAGIISPPPFPEPGTIEDLRMLRLLAQEIDSLPIVRELRQKSRTSAEEREQVEKLGGVKFMERRIGERMKRRIEEEEREDGGGQIDTASVGNDEDELEEVPDWHELHAFVPSDRSLSHAMSGMGGTGVQRVFRSRDGNELITVVWLGGALCGWPGLCHGGAIATLFSEAARRAVVERIHFGDTDIQIAQDPSTMTLTYLKPSNIGQFFVVRAKLGDPDAAAASPADTTALHPKASIPTPAQESLQSMREGQPPFLVTTTLETMDGLVCVKAATTWDR